MSGPDVSYSNLNLKPHFGRSYSNPPNKAVSPENQFFIENSPPSPKKLFLDSKLLLKESKGLEMLLSVPRIPQPIPKDKSKALNFLEPTMYSEENNPVPAISLKPIETAGKK